MLGAVFCEAGKTWGKGSVNTKKRYLRPITACLAVRLHGAVLRCCCECCPAGSTLSWGMVDAAVVLEHPAESFCLQAPRPSTGPHKLRECLPLIIFLRNRLKYALTGDEVKKICMQRFIKIDGKVRTDITYPAGFMGERGGLGQVPQAALLERAGDCLVRLARFWGKDAFLVELKKIQSISNCYLVGVAYCNEYQSQTYL